MSMNEMPQTACNLQSDGPITNSMSMTRLWVAAGGTVGMKDWQVVRLATVKIRDLERQLKAASAKIAALEAERKSV